MGKTSCNPLNSPCMRRRNPCLLSRMKPWWSRLFTTSRQLRWGAYNTNEHYHFCLQIFSPRLKILIVTLSTVTYRKARKVNLSRIQKHLLNLWQSEQKRQHSKKMVLQSLVCPLCRSIFHHQVYSSSESTKIATISWQQYVILSLLSAMQSMTLKYFVA